MEYGTDGRWTEWGWVVLEDSGLDRGDAKERWSDGTRRAVPPRTPLNTAIHPANYHFYSRTFSCFVAITHQIMDLENRNAALTEEASAAPRRGGSASQADWVPRAPAAYTLTGHRSQVRSIFLSLSSFWGLFLLESKGGVSSRLDGKEGRVRFMSSMRKDTYEVASGHSGNLPLHLFNHSCRAYRMGPYIVYLPRVGSTGCVQRAPAIRSWGVRALGWVGVAAFGKIEALRGSEAPGWAGWPDGAPTLRVTIMCLCMVAAATDKGGIPGPTELRLTLAGFSIHTCLFSLCCSG
jgi:hypothetical protein